MAQFAVLIYADDSTHAPDATAEELEEADRHAEELRATGDMVLAYALTPRDMATSIRADGATEGPFVEAEQVVVGFYVLDAPDLAAAVEIARTNPVVGSRHGGVEVRPVHSGGVLPGHGPAAAVSAALGEGSTAS
jgi:hypothetical protein